MKLGKPKAKKKETKKGGNDKEKSLRAYPSPQNSGPEKI